MLIGKYLILLFRNRFMLEFVERFGMTTIYLKDVLSYIHVDAQKDETWDVARGLMLRRQDDESHGVLFQENKKTSQKMSYMEKLKNPLVGDLSLYLDDMNLRTNYFEEWENDVNSK